MFDLLRGMKVVDLTSILLGPYATQLLGDFGADIVKVEPPNGDLFRSARPGHSEKMGAGFLNCNRNKRSIVIDLTRPEGVSALHRLVSTADVLVHNLRPKTARKLGVEYERIRQVKKDIIYCHASGFGGDGALAGQAAYDDTVQAASGLAAINSVAEGEPRYLPTVICDKVGGLHLALAILAGMASRERNGRGVCIEVPMFESMVSLLLLELLSGETFSPALGKTGYDRLSSPFRRPFKTRDGFISIIPYSGEQWSRFLSLIGRHDLVGDGRVTDPMRRSASIDMLYKLVADVAVTRTTDEWLQLLQEHDIPCAHVNRVEDLLDHPHLQDVGMFRYLDHPTEGKLRSVRTPFNIHNATVAADRPAPNLGEDGRTVLRDAGFTETEIEKVVTSGAVRLPAE
jgi:crotonobetainyl-CoA:carnitine CoA-transferase CaiB-like acyl-CoA transferase